MDSKNLGTVKTSAFGLGCMGMSGAYGASDRAESIATVHDALDAGITLLDTGDFYGLGHNEMLLGEVLRTTKREDYQLSVKFGAQISPDGQWLGFDARPSSVKAAASYSLQRLGTDYIDIYRPARLDRAVPIEDTIGAIGELVDAGYVRHIGLSEVGAETIRRAATVRPIADLQIEYSLASRGVENEILGTCRELGIGITAYGVLSRGLIGGHWTKTSGAQDDFRTHSPRFSAQNLDRNLALVDALRSVADELGVTVAQAAIAWVASRGDDVVPLVGARTRTRLSEALGAADVTVTNGQLLRIEAAVPAGEVAGERYAPSQMAALDSERWPNS